MAERGQHSGVVCGKTTQQPVAPFVVAEHDQVGFGEVGAPAVDDLGDAAPLFVGGQPQRGAQALFDRGVAADPGEDERDGGQQLLVLEQLDDVGPRRASEDVRPAAVPAATVARTPFRKPVGLVSVRDVPQQLWVHQQLAAVLLGAASPVVEQVEKPLADHDVLPQRHRAVLVNDHGGVAPHGLDPAAELLGVAHRRRKADKANVFGQVQDHLLPHRAAHPVGEEVHLVHHDMRKPVQGIRIRVQHVAQHFGGHDDDRSIAVDRLIAGQQADTVLAVPAHQVGVFLIAQRLDRRGVEAFSARGQRQVDGELPHHRLACTGRRAHKHAVAVLERPAGALLKVVQRERQLLGERGEFAAKWRRHRPQPPTRSAPRSAV